MYGIVLYVQLLVSLGSRQCFYYDTLRAIENGIDVHIGENKEKKKCSLEIKNVWHCFIVFCMYNCITTGIACSSFFSSYCSFSYHTRSVPNTHVDCLFLGVFVGVGTGTLALVAPPFHFSYFWFGVFGANLLGRTHMS